MYYRQYKGRSEYENYDQPRNNATDDLLAVFHDILNRRKNCFSGLTVLDRLNAYSRTTRLFGL
jgi:hypothetical protein